MLPRILSLSVLAVLLVGCSSADSQSTDTIKAETEVPTSTVQVADVVKEMTDGTIAPDAKLPVVIDFNAVWCPPCRKFAPVFHQIAEEYAGKAVFLSVDVDNAPSAARQFGVSSIPQVSVLMPDSSVTTSVGYMTADELKHFIDEAMK
jgi:thioredoxin 1